MRSVVRLSMLTIVVTVALALASAPAQAHPLGNFTTNTSAGIAVAPDRVTVVYVLDLAEIPTVQARQRMDRDDDEQVGADEGREFADAECARLAGAVTLAIDGQQRDLSPIDTSLDFRPGEGGLVTTRLECRLESAAEVDDGSLIEFEDRNFIDRIGWREVTAVGDGTTLLESDVPTVSSSAVLTAYPAQQLDAPPRVLTARLVAARGGAAAPSVADPDAVTAPASGGLTERFTSLISAREVTAGFVLIAFALALVLGAAHAFAPGHGKTVMAAYVVGQRGNMRHALAIGSTVAVTHTAGVVVLGLVISASTTLVPERLYPIFGVVSGLLIVAIGLGLLRRLLLVRRARSASTAHGAHDHHDEASADAHALHAEHPATVEHTHGGAVHTHVIPTRDMRGRDLIALGFAGGLVPSPSALVVLLAALALGRTWFGVVLVLAYGIGLAAALVVMGLLLVRARELIERWLTRPGRSWVHRLAGVLPIVTASLVIAGGTIVVARALVV